MQRLRDIMSKNVETIHPNATVSEVAERMRQSDVGIIPVVDGKRICGVISDRDIVVRALAGHKDPRNTRAEDVMTQDVHYCYEDDDVVDGAELMKRNHVRRLLVLDHNKNLMGIVSLGDLAVGAGERISGETLRNVSTAGRFSGRLMRAQREVGQRWGAVIAPIVLAVVGIFMIRQRPDFFRWKGRIAGNIQEMRHRRIAA